ncbi:MAG: hypothetical protein CMJ18_11070 [Phycisphaeraceae bacterium]|nr:hypothetical protein [Phycisphaeraceae bacterium]
MHPVTTRTLETPRSGLLAGIAALEPLAPPAIVLESAEGADIRAVEAAVLAAGRPVLAVIGGTLDSGGASDDPLIDAPGPAGDRALASLARTRSALSSLGCVTLIAPIGDGGVPPRLPGADGALADHEAWAAEHRSAREAGADRLCRRLFAFARAEPMVRVLLLTSDDPGALLDAEVTGWVLGEVPENVGLACDTGILGLRASRGDGPIDGWLAEHGGRVALSLVSDHDGAGRSDLLIGTGVLDREILREGFGRAVPRAIRPDPLLPSALVAEATRALDL